MTLVARDRLGQDAVVSWSLLELPLVDRDAVDDVLAGLEHRGFLEGQPHP